MVQFPDDYWEVSGKVKPNVDPVPILDSTQMFPLCRLMMLAEIYNPAQTGDHTRILILHPEKSFKYDRLVLLADSLQQGIKKGALPKKRTLVPSNQSCDPMSIGCYSGKSVHR
jgi:hypothetical protein